MKPARKKTDTAMKVAALLQPTEAIKRKYSFLEDFLSYGWREIPLRSAYGVYAVCLYGNYPDYLEVGTQALTEGGDDKNIDLFHMDREAGHVFIAQCYLAEQWEKPEAPSSKADDLLTGLAWVLNQDLDAVPLALRSQAAELQNEISEGDDLTIHLLFIHNCLASENVRASLSTVATSAQTLVQSQRVHIAAQEISLDRLQHLYNSLTKQIVVEDTFDLACDQSVQESTESWKALSTTVPAAWLHDLWQKYGDDLFSANVRGFLDMLRRRASVNKGILETIQREPQNFWAYNNGITILTKKITQKDNTVTISGLSVINGAQTTGVIGNAPQSSAKQARVPCRFIECDDPKIILEIIDNNNTQNAIRSFDIRSNDPTQRRLGVDFKKYKIVYKHRREGATRLPPGAIQAETIAPYLAAFHGDFQVAIRQRRTIFEDRSTYSRVFRPDIRVEHVYAIQCLFDALSEIKGLLREKITTETANKPERVMHEVMRHSSSMFFVAAIVGNLIDQLLGRAKVDTFSVATKARFVRVDREKMVSAWRIALEAVIPLVAQQSGGDTYEFVRSASQIAEVAEKVGFTLQAIRHQVASSFAPIRDALEV